MNASEWASVVNRTIEAQIERLIALAPSLAAALVIILAGCLLAWLASMLVRRIVAAVVTKLSQRADLQRGLESGGLHAMLPRIASSVVFWAVVLLFVGAGVEQLGIPAVSALLQEAAYFLPRLLVGLVIVAAGMIGGDLAAQWAGAALSPAGVAQSQAIGRVLQVVVVAVALVVAADQIGIHSTFLMLALAIGLGVTLGGVALAFALGCGPIVGNIVAAHYVAKRFEPGQRARIGESSGEIGEITATFVVLRTATGEILVPAKKFMEEAAAIEASPTAGERS
jgi:small-conductance mechanosensitive channel